MNYKYKVTSPDVEIEGAKIIKTINEKDEVRR